MTILYLSNTLRVLFDVVQTLYRMLLENQVDAVTFISPMSVRILASLIGREQAADLNTTVAAAIGPVTAAAELGIHTTLVPETYTVIC